MSSFNVRQARIAITAAKSQKNVVVRQNIYRYFGFTKTIDIQKINYYVPIIDLIEKECGIKINTIECSKDILFDRWVQFLSESGEKIEFA